jgi:hypothetical protein
VPEEQLFRRRFAESTEYFIFIRKELAGMLARWHEHKARTSGTAGTPHR